MEESPTPLSAPKELLLLVWVHGFKGGVDTFGGFSERLEHLLSAVQPNTRVLSVVYPPYETRGELIDAVVRHVEWVEELVAERTKEYNEAGGTGPVSVVLLGHSMGGLVIADAALSILNSAPPKPNILGLVAYDTPYWGLNPAVFKNTAEKVLGYAQQGQSLLTGLGVGIGAFNAFRSGNKEKETESPAVPPPVSTPAASSSSSKAKEKTVATSSTSSSNPPSKSSTWFSTPVVAVLGAAVVAAGVGAAYWNKSAISQNWDWGVSHLSYVGELWKTELLEKRMTMVFGAKGGKGIRFHCYYTLLPPNTSSTLSSARSFIVLPPKPFRDSFTFNKNNRASDEIQAHTEMFTEQSDGMYALGSETCKLVSAWLDDERKGGGAEKNSTGPSSGKSSSEKMV